MRHFYLTFLALLLTSSAFAQAKTGISVARFADKTEKSRCPGLTRKAKADLDMKLQSQLIAGLMQLKRFQIREREVRSLKPEHSIVGAVRAFEVCAGQGRGQIARIELEVQMLSAKGDLTHMFSSSASTSSAADNLAPQMAMKSAINELIRRIDDAVPRKGSLRLTSKRGLSSSPMIVKLVPRERR